MEWCASLARRKVGSPNRSWLGLAIAMLMNRCESGNAHNLPVSFLRAPHSMALFVSQGQRAKLLLC
jgi:hypothetical protein